MWYLLLILGVIAVSADDYESYGCKFKDSYNLVAVNNEGSTKLEEFRRLMFGERMPGIMFNHVENRNFMSKIKEVYKNTMETFVLSDIPQFYKFYDHYEVKSNHRTFEEIYKSFSYDLHYESFSSYSFAIKLIEELLAKVENPDLKKHVCLVAVYENKAYPKAFIRERHNDPEQFIISHVAVLIRRTYCENNPGVILMDMGYKSFGPTELALSQSCTPDDLDRWELKWDSTKKFVTVDKYPTATRVPNIFYIEKPYCSFATTTFKRQLLANTTKSIIRRDRRGDPTVSISFDVTEANPKFTMTTYEYVGNGRRHRECLQETTVVKFHELDSMNENQKVHYNKVLSKFKIPNPADAEKKSNIDEKYVRDILHRAVKISHDTNFIKEYKNFLPNLLKLRGEKRKMEEEEIHYDPDGY